MYIYDSVKKKKLPFSSLVEGKVNLYVCGPTVYDDAHLGHAKSALVFDLLKRVLMANNYEVTYARNITDVDDKIIKKAQEHNATIEEISQKYYEAYTNDMKALGVMPPDIEPRATQTLDNIYAMIQKLLDEGYAYQTSNEDVYFDTQKDAKYLSISHQHQDEASRQERVSSSNEKKHPSDFALWKATHDESVSFEAPFAKGRPGWHIECSAMIDKLFRDAGDEAFTLDIHGGGMDLLFPHHENEAAQSRCSTHKELAKYWVHNGFVNIDGQKMSKSLGNSFFIKDALKVYSGEVLRFYLLSSYYRNNFNFSEEDLLASKKRLDKLYRLKKRLFGMKATEFQTDFQKDLLKALSDDLNVSLAYALIDEMINHANEVLDSEPKNKLIKKETLANFAYIEKILGFGLNNPFEYFQFGMDETLKKEIEVLIEKRTLAKKAKDFASSDALRDKILSFGVQIMDTAAGTFWEKVE